MTVKSMALVLVDLITCFGRREGGNESIVQICDYYSTR